MQAATGNKRWPYSQEANGFSKQIEKKKIKISLPKMSKLTQAILAHNQRPNGVIICETAIRHGWHTYPLILLLSHDEDSSNECLVVV